MFTYLLLGLVMQQSSYNHFVVSSVLKILIGDDDDDDDDIAGYIFQCTVHRNGNLIDELPVEKRRLSKLIIICRI